MERVGLSPDGVWVSGHGGNPPGQGPFLDIRLRVSEGLVLEAKYETYQCPACHDCGILGRAPETMIFPGFKAKRAAKNIYRDLAAAGVSVRAFGGKGCFHSLRVSMVNYAIETADAKTAQTLARHKTLDLTMNVYGRSNAEHVRAATEALGKAIEGAEIARISRKEVKCEPLALAAGAENLAQLHEAEEDERLVDARVGKDSNPSAPALIRKRGPSARWPAGIPSHPRVG